MKFLSGIVFLIFWSLPICFSQAISNDTFHLSKLPPEGILLDKGWKFHAGDDSAWANPGFNDNQWEKENPDIDIHELLKQKETENIGWFRLKFEVDSSLQNSSAALIISQVVASEIYLNGQLLYRFGTVSDGYNKEQTHSLNDRPFIMHFGRQHIQELAVRYSFNHRKFLIRFDSNPCVRLILKSPNQGFADYTFANILDIALFVSIISIYLFLGLFCLYFYASFRNEKAYLYIAIECLGQAIAIILYITSFHTAKSISSSSIIYIIANTISSIGLIFLLNAFYIFFKYPKPRYYNFFIFYILLAIPLSFIFYSYGRILMACFGAILTLEVFLISIKGVYKKRPGSWIVLISNSVALIFLFGNVYFVIQGDFVNARNFVAVIFVIVPVYLSFFMAGEFARSGLALQKRAVEIKQLSDKTIAQEMERQQILSSQKETLEQQVAERTAELKQSLQELKSAHAQLIQSEKMASLGELTAGIAHEIQNPLNFVNNFSEVNTELIDETETAINDDKPSEAKELLASLRSNQIKINHHGKRADAIVKGMLQHSRTSTGQRESIDLNRLVDEYLRISYLGLRTRDNSFNSKIETHFDQDINRINIIPQEIGRVLLNLYNNAFYAVTEKKKQQSEGYEPTVTVSTVKTNDRVEVRVKDNGNGIPKKILDKIFQPFFTTKPTGQGTGLGLSLSYDIIKAHGGKIKVDTREGEFTEFVIQLPISV